MKHFKHILATTDLSPESFSAVSYAAHLAKAQGSKLTVLHVPHSISLAYTEFVPPVDLVGIDDALERAAKEKIEDWIGRHVRGVSNVKIAVENGVVDETICDFAEQCGASVIVIATHGRKGLGHLVLGSIAERVVRGAPCPVLVVKPQSPAIDVSKKSSRKKAAKKTTKRAKSSRSK